MNTIAWELDFSKCYVYDEWQGLTDKWKEMNKCKGMVHNYNDACLK